MPSRERFWPSRLRWRLRGALQWPAFVVLTLLDGIVLSELPPAAIRDPNIIVGVLLATFANLFILGALAPFLTRRMLRRRHAALAAAGAAPSSEAAQTEREVTQDRIATGLLIAGLFGCLVAGVANRPTIVSETEATEENARAVQEFVIHSGDEELDRNLETAQTIRLEEGYFRTCIARDDRERFVCFLVDTDKEPTQIRRDPSGEPNSAFDGRPG